MPIQPADPPWLEELRGQPAKYLSFRELREKRGGRSRTTIYRDVDLGRLPKPLKIGGRLFWIEAAVDAVIFEQQAA